MSGYLDTGLLSPVSAGTAAEAELSDAAWLQAMLDAEAALAAAQADIGVLPRGAADVIARAAAGHGIDVRAVALSARETANPVVGLIKELSRVVDEIEPSATDYVHRGSTSQDILDTGAMIVAKRVLGIVATDLGYTADALAELAGAHSGTVMAARTLATQAVPTTFGLKASGWRQLILEARARCGRAGGCAAGISWWGGRNSCRISGICGAARSRSGSVRREAERGIRGQDRAGRIRPAVACAAYPDSGYRQYDGICDGCTREVRGRCADVEPHRDCRGGGAGSAGAWGVLGYAT
ncbi:lyase family protein [Mycobacteroides abscessus subsp. bolletii 1513]|uniref:Lyase family protein n=1 Tax=Mycobacteroides abscessus subsp. bolletii 1513 TaxID=1299321 RepID=X8E065_9MYCO|nr:lyase family protein [Mycobacteroides abscessus subsp. bolletii 1513]